jgi:SAM-dependent methyltransferase
LSNRFSSRGIRRSRDNRNPDFIFESCTIVKDSRPDVITSDILSFPGIDVVADAHRLPFADQSFAGAVMLDVLHHLERPIEFLKEASRVLKPGGRLAMIEPAMTVVARRFYHHFHVEPGGYERRRLCSRPRQRAGALKRSFPRCASAVSKGSACLPIR